MRGVYAVGFDQQSFTTANGNYDFFEIDPAADKPIKIVAIFISNKSEIADAQEEMVAWSIVRFSGGTFSSGNGTGGNENPLDPSDGAASFVSEVVASSIATTTGTSVILHNDTFNIRVGLQLIFPPDMRPKCDGAAQSAIVVRMDSTLADDATLSGTIYVQEV